MAQHIFEHGGNIYGASPVGGWLDFSANINPLGLSATIRQAVAEHIEGIVHYPDPQGRRLKEGLSQYYDIPYESIILGNGAAELFYIFFHACRPQRTLLPVPSFSEYERAARAGNSQVEYLYLSSRNGFVMPWQQLLSQCQHVDCIVLGNPNNPTGNLLRTGDIEKLAAKARNEGTMVLVDESFLDFREDREAYTAMPLVSAYDNLIVLQSLTKFYALPGLRLGFAVASPAAVRQLEMHKDVWNVNYLAQVAGVAALSDRYWQEQTRHFICTEKKWFYEQVLSMQGFQVYEPSVNFVLLSVTNHRMTAASLTAILRKQGILVRDCSNYPGMDVYHIRTAVRERSENERLLRALKKV
jgi:threonine-phosphate decarboxylase